MSGANFPLPPLELRGPEVALRPLAVDDAEELASAASECREHYGYSSVPDGLDEARRYIERALRQRDAGRRLPFKILWRGRVVGSTGYSDYQTWEWPVGSSLRRTDRPDAVEIGFTWLAASAQRTPCNTEAKYLLLAHAFDVWDVHRASFRTDERNERSRRAVERLGARLEGIRLADTPGRDGAVRNSAYYSILRADWPAVRERLTGFLARRAEIRPVL
jgi:RimJ/RimL family protein N-acetyltransferase